MEELKLTPEMLERLRRETAELTSSLKMTRYDPCLCGKLLDTLAWERKWHSGRWNGKQQLTPGVNYTDLLCGDCRQEFRGSPRIVCLGCRRLMGFYKPGRQWSGFVFEKNRHYHIVSCPQCDPKSPMTPVLEHEKFCRDRGIPTKVEEDLLQEIEQRLLQAEKEAVRLRMEYEASIRR